MLFSAKGICSRFNLDFFVRTVFAFALLSSINHREHEPWVPASVSKYNWRLLLCKLTLENRQTIKLTTRLFRLLYFSSHQVSLNSHLRTTATDSFFVRNYSMIKFLNHNSLFLAKPHAMESSHELSF